MYVCVTSRPIDLRHRAGFIHNTATSLLMTSIYCLQFVIAFSASRVDRVVMELLPL